MPDMWQPFLPLARQAIVEPREAATTLMSMGVPNAALWPAFTLFIALSALLGGVTDLLGGAPAGATTGALGGALLSWAINVASVFAVWKVGQAMSGTGSFHETLLLMVFLLGIMLIGQAAMLVLWIISPPLSGFLLMALIVLAFWLNLNFIAALHGFPSLLRALGCLLVASGGVAVALLFILTILGIPFMETPTNV